MRAFSIFFLSFGALGGLVRGLVRGPFDPTENYYEALNVLSTAGPKEIKKAYHAEVRKLHPDKNVGDEIWATTETKKIVKAYEVLSDESVRQQYNQAVDFRTIRAYDNSFSALQAQRAEHDTLWATYAGNRAGRDDPIDSLRSEFEKLWKKYKKALAVYEKEKVKGLGWASGSAIDETAGKKPPGWTIAIAEETALQNMRIRRKKLTGKMTLSEKLKANKKREARNAANSNPFAKAAVND